MASDPAGKSRIHPAYFVDGSSGGIQEGIAEPLTLFGPPWERGYSCPPSWVWKEAKIDSPARGNGGHPRKTRQRSAKSSRASARMTSDPARRSESILPTPSRSPISPHRIRENDQDHRRNRKPDHRKSPLRPPDFPCGHRVFGQSEKGGDRSDGNGRNEQEIGQAPRHRSVVDCLPKVRS